MLHRRFLGLELTPGTLAGAAGKVTTGGLPANPAGADAGYAEADCLISDAGRMISGRLGP